MRFFSSKKNRQESLNVTRAISVTYLIFDKMFMSQIASTHGIPDRMIDGMEAHVHAQSTKLAWMTVLLIKQQTDRLFRSGPEFSEFVALGAKLIKSYLVDPEFEGTEGRNMLPLLRRIALPTASVQWMKRSRILSMRRQCCR